MIEEIISQWEENKLKLEEYFKTTNQSEYSTYREILIAVFIFCIHKADDYSGWNLKKMTFIDDGDYQGTQIFIIPKDTYQPCSSDYVVTDTYYGSCSGCDTLQSINSYEDGLPTEKQVKEYMTLALHLVQKMHWLSNEDE